MYKNKEIYFENQKNVYMSQKPKLSKYAKIYIKKI